MRIQIPAQARKILQNPQTQLYLSISGGKDSDALVYRTLAEQLLCKIELLHCDLGRMDWHNTAEYVEHFAERVGLPLNVIRYEHGDLIDAIRDRMKKRPDVPPFPSAKARYCTSSFKRQVTDKFVRKRMPKQGNVVVAMGIRGAESASRRAKVIWSERKSACAPTKGRYVWDWLPIHHFTLDDVWQTIRENGNVFHEAYSHGNSRLSCAMCVLANQNDLMNGAIHNPDTYLELCRIELESGFSFQPNKWLCSLRPELLSDTERQRFAELQAHSQPQKLPKPIKTDAKSKQLHLFPEGVIR